MAESKIDFSYENLHFSCEGDKDWVEARLNQILNHIPGLMGTGRLVKSESNMPVASKEDATAADAITEIRERRKRVNKARATGEEATADSSGNPLAGFLKEKNAENNQVRKFLATAVFLHAQGVEKFSTPMISRQLKSSQIDKLINASDCLNKNEKKGFCLKDDKEFILTEAGIHSIVGGSEA